MDIINILHSAEHGISSAQEDYLKTIYTLSLEKNSVRTTDIAARLGISKPSVNKAVNSLKTRGLVFHEPYGDIRLTPSGERLGNIFFLRYKTIKKFLTDVLGIADGPAEREAKSIGGTVSSSTIKKMAEFMDR